MPGIRDANQRMLAGNADTLSGLDAVRQQALDRKQDPGLLNDPLAQAKLDKVANDCAHQQKVVTQEAQLRQNLENAYVATDKQVPPPANPDADPGVKSALGALKEHRASNAPDYPNNALTGGCIKCEQKALARAQTTQTTRTSDPPGVASVRPDWDGQPYVWGKTDCSHAVDAANPELKGLNSDGIKGRLSSSPAWGTHSLSEAQPGDILHFPGHVEVVTSRGENGLNTWGCRTADSQNQNGGCGDAFFKDSYLNKKGSTIFTKH